MTADQVHDARMIPCAYEPNTPPHRATQAARLVAAAPIHEVRPHAATAIAPYVVAAPAQPTTRLGRAAAILGDVALVTALIFAGALVPGLALKGITTAVVLILEMFGRQ
jgi:hypothetical protein